MEQNRSSADKDSGTEGTEDLTMKSLTSNLPFYTLIFFGGVLGMFGFVSFYWGVPFDSPVSAVVILIFVLGFIFNCLGLAIFSPHLWRKKFKTSTTRTAERTPSGSDLNQDFLNFHFTLNLPTPNLSTTGPEGTPPERLTPHLFPKVELEHANPVLFEPPTRTFSPLGALPPDSVTRFSSPGLNEEPFLGLREIVIFAVLATVVLLFLAENFTPNQFGAAFLTLCILSLYAFRIHRNHGRKRKKVRPSDAPKADFPIDLPPNSPEYLKGEVSVAPVVIPQGPPPAMIEPEVAQTPKNLPPQQHISKLQFPDGTFLNIGVEEMEALMRIQEMVGLPKNRMALTRTQVERVLICGKTLQKPFAPLPAGPFTLNAGEKLLFSVKALHIFPIPSTAQKVHFPLEQHLLAFQGLQNPLPTTTSIAQGTIGFTNRRLLFFSTEKALTIDFDTISMLDMFTDAIGVYSTTDPRKAYFVVENPPLVLLVMNQIFQSQ